MASVYGNQVLLPTKTRVVCLGGGSDELGNITWTSYSGQTEVGVTLVISVDQGQTKVLSVIDHLTVGSQLM